ncbi:hypothetical protein E3N88_15061 [Mikania micrantha]|uniref:Uncharacterized protein n=1 Tax=Mikania micrantha TaxID=192012 RepID=A0A5N6P4Z4_9ASTR|nr:hypothetical protein E3N88_15061 [Mikania micrantha]
MLPESRNEDKTKIWPPWTRAWIAPGNVSASLDHLFTRRTSFEEVTVHSNLLDWNLSSGIINNINYLMTIKAMSLTLNVQKDSIRYHCEVRKPVDYVSPVEEVLYMYEPVNFGLAVEVSCIYTSLSTSGRQLRCLVLHKPVDFGSTVEAKFSVQYD